MSFNLDGIAIDLKKLEHGVIWEVHREPDGSIGGRPVPAPTANACLLVVPFGAAYERARDAAMAPFVHLDRSGRMTEPERRQVLAEALGRAVLRGMWNFVRAGKPIDWTEQRGIELLSDPEMLSLREFVQRAAGHRAALLAHIEEESSKN